MSTRRLLQVSLLATALCFLSMPSDALADAVQWRQNLDAAKIEAAQTGKLVLLHFWSPSCGPCKQLDSDVFSQPQIGQFLEQNFVPVKLNADTSPAFAGLYSIDRVPTDVVLTPQSNVVAKLSCPLTPSGYGTQLANLVQHYRQQTAAQKAPPQAPMQSAYAGLKIGQYNQAPPTTTPPVSPQQAAAPQVSSNPYASAMANPQTPGQPVSVAPGRYQNRYATAAIPTTATPPATPPAAIQTTSAQTVLQSPQAATPPIAATANMAAATTPPAAQKPAGPPKLPEGTPPLAFEGYCPVTLKQARKWILGNLKYGAIHRGRTYLFTGETQRQQFLANPDAFSPVFSGMDAVKLLDENKTVEGSRKFGFEYRGAFYLFTSQESMARFASQPDHYAAGVRQAMTRMDGIDTLRR